MPLKKLYPALVAVIVTTFTTIPPANAGALFINYVGSITDSSVLGAINTAISDVTSLYNTGSGAGNVTLNVDFTYSSAAAGNLASSSQYFYGYSYNAYTRALKTDSKNNSGNTNLATAVSHLAYGNKGNMAITYGQAFLLGQYGLGNPVFAGNDAINLSSSVTNWNFTGTATSSQYDAIGALEHELDELLGIGGGGSVLGDCAIDSFFCTYSLGATDLYRYSAAGTPSTSTTSPTYLSINGGNTSIVDFNTTSPGDYGDFAPACGPTSNNSGNNQYIQNAFNCMGMDETYSTSSPEYIATTAIGWDPAVSTSVKKHSTSILGASTSAGIQGTSTAVPEPSTYILFATGLIAINELRRRRKV